MGGSLGKSESSNQNAYNNESGNQNSFGNDYASGNQNQFGSDSGSQNQTGNQAGFGQNVWGPQGDALQGMYGQMGGLFDQTNQQMQGQIPGAVGQQQGVFNAANPAWQQQMGGGAFQGMDLQGNYQNALQGGGNEQFMNESIMGGAGNNYVDAMKNQLQDDSSQNLGRSLAMNDQRASNNGMSGSSRHGLTESRLYDDANDRLANQQTGIGFGSFDKDLDRKLGIAQRADQFDMGRLNNASGMLGAQQGAMAGGIGMGGAMQNLGMGQFNPSMAPWQAAGQYAQNMGGPTVLGSGSSSGFGSGSGFGSSSGSGSGSSTGGGYGQGSGYSLGSGYGSGSSKGLGASGGK